MKKQFAVGRGWGSFVATLLLAVSAAGARGQTLATGDARTVTEPAIPVICSTLAAQTYISSGVPASETVTNTSPDTARVQTALSACASGKAVELSVSGSNDAFLIGPIFIPSGVTLFIDGGVTVFASRAAADYQASGANDTCGINGTHGDGCNPLITIGESSVNGNSTSTGSGLMGYGVINARGNEKVILSGAVSTTSWWDLASNARTGPNTSQNNPVMVVAYKSNSGSIYKITLLNSPHFHVSTHYNTGFTVWGLKLLTPWTARNSDGVDPSGATNFTITNSVIGDADDEVAIGGSSAASNFTFSNLLLSSGHGLSIGSITSAGVSNVLANNIAFSGQAADTNQTGLHIKSAADRGGLVNQVTYQNVCMQNVYQAIQLDPLYNTNSGTEYPHYTNITYANVHILSGTVTPHIEFSGYNSSYLSTVWLDNVVSDRTPTISPAWQDATITFIDSISGTAAPYVYPTALSNTTGTGVTYTNSATVSNSAAISCTNKFPALVGELYAVSPASVTAPNTMSVTNPATFSLNAMVEPTNSEVSYTDPNTGGVYTGVSVPSGTVTFYDGATSAGTGTLSSNGTLATATITNPTTGTHTYTATIAADTHYSALTFGSLTVTVTAGPATQAAFTTAPPATLTYGTAPGTVKVALEDVSGSVSTSTATVTLKVTNSATSYSATYTASASAGTATFSLTSSLPQVGTYVYTASATGVTSATANESVTQATLTVTANAASKVFDAPNPTFTATITGYVNSDPSTVVSGSPVITTTAARNAAVGSYPTVVAQGTLTATNYNFQLVGGTLAITGAAPQSINFAALPNFASGASYQLTAGTTSGLKATYTVSGPASVSGSTLTVSGPGSITVTAASAATTNYAAATNVAQTFTAH